MANALKKTEDEDAGVKLRCKDILSRVEKSRMGRGVD